MLVTRLRPKAQLKRERRADAAEQFVGTLSAKEFAALWQIKNGIVSHRAMREKLVSKGLITSVVGSRCCLTSVGESVMLLRKQQA